MILLYPRRFRFLRFLQDKRLRWLCGFSLLALLTVGVTVRALWTRHGIAKRVPNETVRFPLSPPSNTCWTTENALPNLRFFEPTCVAAAHDGSNRLFVLERRGTIQVVVNDPQTSEKQQVLDISEHVVRTPYDDDGALGLILHPQFGQPGSPNRDYLYVFYTAKVDKQCYDRLSRFTLIPGAQRIDPASELVLIDQLDENLWHNGGALAFGADGFLYVGVGDEGTNGDGLSNGQRIDKDLFCGILRIDVDLVGGDVSHPPIRQPETGRTANYFIPNDNPFVGVPGVLEEFWSHGLRNPHRISFDPATGWLWVGDVGHLLREEVNLATKGSNHGWSYIEGNLPFAESYLKGEKPRPYRGVETPPIFQYPHLNGNNCVIGGFVYRGAKYPDLFGKYVYADNGSGRVWALDYDGTKVQSNVELLSLPVTSKTGISSLGQDQNGELLILVLGEADLVDGTIHRIVAASPGSSPSLPRLLSETDIFADLQTLTPNPGVYPYDVNSPLWSDGAVKRRWIILPGVGTDPDPATDRIEFSPAGSWKFPTGTMFVKHFELPVDENDPSLTKRLETRVLVRESTGGVYGLTYKWNDAGTDAVLLDDGFEESIAVRTTAGGQRMQTWQYPSRQTCLVCHNEHAGHVLGVNARQLNGDYRYPESGVVRNQLQEWSRAGLFTRSLDDDEIQNTPRLVSIHDQRFDLETRVRSYLDANCASCHRPGMARAGFDARFDSPLDATNLIGGLPITPDVLPGALLIRPGDPSHSMLVHRLLHREKRMPPVGVLRRDVDAITLLSQWIDSLPPPPEDLQKAEDETISDSGDVGQSKS